LGRRWADALFRSIVKMKMVSVYASGRKYYHNISVLLSVIFLRLKKNTGSFLCNILILWQ